MKNTLRLLSLLMAAAVLLSACANAQASAASAGSGSGTGKTVEYSLTTAMQDGKMVFVGVGGGIDGVANPTLSANVGDTLKITLTTSDGMEHSITFPDFKAASKHVVGQGASTTLQFAVTKAGSFVYYCDLPGHREAGMEGKFEVTGTTASDSSVATAPPSNSAPAAVGPVVVNNPPTTGADIVRDPTDLPAPIGNRGPEKVRIDLEAEEIVGQLADGATYTYWTFNGKVPGPFFRVRVGDTVEVHFKNPASSTMAHSVDFHAVTGPGGGAVFSNTPPGQETMFTFKALVPGIFVYHCATPMVAQHISNGMYGMILVEPEGGLPPVDREFYVMQGEI